LRRAIFITLLAAACWNPVHADAVDALGPEDPNVPIGPLHRAGQPCTTCHAGSGPGEPDFVVAGTIYRKKRGSEPLVGALVTISSTDGTSVKRTTNEVGNFYVETSEWSPKFPLTVALAFGDVRKEMKTKIGRDGGCGGCHRGVGDKALMPAVYLDE
jgi:hypothetical protein